MGISSLNYCLINANIAMKCVPFVPLVNIIDTHRAEKTQLSPIPPTPITGSSATDGLQCIRDFPQVGIQR